MTTLNKIQKQNLKARDIYHLLIKYTNIEMKERTFYKHLETDFISHDNELLIKRKIDGILKEYKSFLLRLC